MPRCEYRNDKFKRPNAYSNFSENKIHDGTDQCWVEGGTNIGIVKDNKFYCTLHNPDLKLPVHDFNQSMISIRLNQSRILKDLITLWCRRNIQREKNGQTILSFLLPGMTCGLIRLENLSFLGAVDFSEAIFNGNSSFDDTTFCDQAIFDNVIFSFQARFQNTLFENSANFKKTVFKNAAWFLESNFKRGAWFSAAHFENYGEFSNASFSSNAWFGESYFKTGVRFVGAVFNGEAVFDKVNFGGHATFNTAYFAESASFAGTIFQNNTRFKNNTLLKGSTFTDCKIKKFEYVSHIGEKMLFNGCSGTFSFAKQSCSRLSFLNMNLSNADFFGADIIGARFDSCEWEKVGDLRYSKVYGHDEIIKENNKDKLTLLKSHYRQLKKNLEDSKEYQQAGDFHYREMEIREALLKLEEKNWGRTGELLVLRLYRSVADYGESYWKLLLSLFDSIFIASLLVILINDLMKPVCDDIKGKYIFLISELQTIIFSIIPSAFQKTGANVCIHPLGQTLILLETLIVFVLASLFVMAIRRRFRR